MTSTAISPRPSAKRSGRRARGRRGLRTASAADLDAAEHQSKEKILTPSEPAKIRKSSDLKEGSVFLLTEESRDVPFEVRHGFGLNL
jgi:hypothetical protein